jgi:hypothetical protein
VTVTTLSTPAIALTVVLVAQLLDLLGRRLLELLPRLQDLEEQVVVAHVVRLLGVEAELLELVSAGSGDASEWSRS